MASMPVSARSRAALRAPSTSAPNWSLSESAQLRARGPLLGRSRWGLSGRRGLHEGPAVCGRSQKIPGTFAVTRPTPWPGGGPGAPGAGDTSVAHMEGRLSRGRGCRPLRGWCSWCVVAAGEAVRAFRGSRRLVMLIFGGWVPQDLCSSHVRCLKSSAPGPGAGCSGDETRSCVRESGSARAASPAATGCQSA
jgi:hypothetical protein